MTGDELAEVLHREQGYLVVSFHKKYPQGSVFRPSGSVKCGIPLLITGESDRSEYRKQIKRAQKLSGFQLQIPKDHKFFYRATAAD